MADDITQPLLLDQVTPHEIVVDIPKEEHENICRICFEGGDQSDDPLFQPCKCNGTNKYVHRNCLNQWRATANNPEAFRRCFTCNYEYKFQHHQEATLNYCSDINQNLADYPIIICVFMFTIMLSITYIVQNLDKKNVILKAYKSMNLIKFRIEPVDTDFFIYYIFVAHLVLFLITVLFMINIIRMKNRIMYLKYCFGNSSLLRYIISGTMIGLMIMSFSVSSILSSICITLIIQFFIRTHYNFLRYLHRATSSEISPYSG